MVSFANIQPEAQLIPDNHQKKKIRAIPLQLRKQMQK